MRSLLLTAALLLSTPALAAPGDAAAIEPEGSLWDFIEASTGTLPSPATLEASTELAEERFAEERFLGDPAGASAYTDPVAASTDGPLYISLLDPAEFDIPIEFNSSVEKWMNYFLGSGRKYYQKWLGRSSKFRPMMYRILKEKGLPADTVYLSMIESGYATHARSHAAAVGLWQFMSYTGREYDLRVDYWLDERRDPELATHAAANFLKRLHSTFDNWYLAWAGYNAGAGRMKKAIRANGTKDWWALAKSNSLHPETRNYVSKIIAAAIIGKHPSRYGFTDIEYQDELVYDTVDVEGSVSIDVLAKLADVTVEEIEALNPALVRGATPPDGVTHVRVPVETGETFAARLDELPPEDRVTYRRHRVAKGESLGRIASRYGVTTSALAGFNKIANPNRIYVGMDLIIPVPGATPSPEVIAASAPSTSASTAKKAAPAPATVKHTVSRGDTLSGIASRYGVTSRVVQSANGLRDADQIKVGQVLSIQGGTPAAQLQASYTVRKGDSMSKIAARFGCSVSDLQSWNGIRDASSIRAGQTLKLYPSSGGWTNYTVQTGDSLGRIAKRYSCSVTDIKSWNDLNSSTIHPGQKLKIRRS